MKKLLALSAGALIATGVGFAQLHAAGGANLLTSIPPGSLTVTDWYKQNVYDPSNNKIGEVMDVLVSSSDGKVDALIVGVGGFLGAGEKDVAVPFESVKETMQDNNIRLTMNATKDELKSAPGFKYDKQKTTWVPDTSNNNKATQ